MLSRELIKDALFKALATGADFAEVFAERTLSKNITRHPEEMLSLAGDGVYVTEISGLHAGANPITGDFSLSSKGFLITEGKKGAPVKSFTVSGNFFTLLKEIEKLGTDLDFVNGKYGAPSVLVRNMAVAGK